MAMDQMRKEREAAKEAHKLSVQRGLNDIEDGVAIFGINKWNMSRVVPQDGSAQFGFGK
jgi:hypothetical protein